MHTVLWKLEPDEAPMSRCWKMLEKLGRNGRDDNDVLELGGGGEERSIKDDVKGAGGT